ncbi:MAG: hypothetical protein H8D23_38360 [Candidatus Brocadiales bacterium]|nr:hypothetical protein [Candidatus Brocadiales bacterium]
MSKVASDLESLIDFRNRLVHFNREIDQNFSNMLSAYRDVGKVWSDAKFNEFGKALEDAGRGVNHYLHATQSHEAHLLRLIETLRSYLDQSI